MYKARYYPLLLRSAVTASQVLWEHGTSNHTAGYRCTVPDMQMDLAGRRYGLLANLAIPGVGRLGIWVGDTGGRGCAGNGRSVSFRSFPPALGGATAVVLSLSAAAGLGWIGIPSKMAVKEAYPSTAAL